jgi:ketosteroid isomerase-like protein
MNLRSAAPVAAMLLVVGCQISHVDVAKEKDTLLSTDREWAQMASNGQNADSILSYWTDDATVASPGLPLVKGKPAIRQMVTSGFGTPGFHITWTPEKAVVANSGELGYTSGVGDYTVPNATKNGMVTIHVQYLTVWRRDPDGRWRCSEDYSVPVAPDTTKTAG